MKHATATSTLARPSTRACLRWLASALAALLFIQLGVWLGRSVSSASSPGLVWSSAIAGDALPFDAAPRRSTASKQELLATCRHAVIPLKPSCPRQLVVKYLTSAGFGHQFTEMLFGMYAAQYLGLTFTWNSFATSGDHGDDYSGLVKTLGLEHLFVEGLGLMRADELRELRETMSVSSQSLISFGQWIEASHLDKRQIVSNLACNNSVLAIEGWWHCRGVAENNCFWAPEHQFLFQRYGECLRAGVKAYGSAFDRCVLSSQGQVYLPHDTLVVVWHLRFGDVAMRNAHDETAFFENVVGALRTSMGQGRDGRGDAGSGVKRVRLVLVGGGKGMAEVPQACVDRLQKAIDDNDDKGGGTTQALFQVESFRNTSFEQQFLAMMQADVLIGSGSSLPQVAALLSGRPLFFDHVAKHGYNYGQEALGDAVDMDAQGKVLDSLRRVKLKMFSTMRAGDGAGRPCRRRREV